MPEQDPPAAPPLDLDAAETELADVEHALGALDDGRYGTCEVCGERLDDALLADAPAARSCARHAAVR